MGDNGLPAALATIIGAVIVGAIIFAGLILIFAATVPAK